MTLSRWRRLATGIAAGVLVLCAAILGASFRSESNPVSVASDLRPTDVIAIPEDDDEVVAVDADGDDETDSVQVIEVDDLPEDESADEPDVAADPDRDPADSADADVADADVADADSADTGATDTDAADSADTGAPDTDAADSADADSADTADAATADAGEDAAPADAAEEAAPDEEDATEDAAAEEQAAPAEPPAPTPTPAPAPPPASNGDALGTGGGVNDAECGLDRLVIYAGAPVGGVAGRLRAALAQNGFGAGCAQPVTVLASNCPQQFSGVLREPGYDPSRPYVAASANVDRDTMISIVGSTGYTGSTIDILNFGFVNPDRPGEQWVAIFVPPSFSGWEGLASQAGLAPSSGSLCGPSGELGR